MSGATSHQHCISLHFRRRGAAVRALDVSEVLRNAFGATRAFGGWRASPGVAGGGGFVLAAGRRAGRLQKDKNAVSSMNFFIVSTLTC